MKLSVCVMANIDEIGFFNHAETLGYDSVWVGDSLLARPRHEPAWRTAGD